MLRTAFRLLMRVGLVVGVAASFGTGCSRQAEGERCDFAWAGDQDCDDGLVCTPCGNLQLQGEDQVDRCCKPGGSYTDTRCIPTTNPTGIDCNQHLASNGGTTSSGGSTGTGGTGGTTSTGGTGDMTSASGSSSDAGNGASSGATGTPETPDGG